MPVIHYNPGGGDTVACGAARPLVSRRLPDTPRLADVTCKRCLRSFGYKDAEDYRNHNHNRQKEENE